MTVSQSSNMKVSTGEYEVRASDWWRGLDVVILKTVNGALKRAKRLSRTYEIVTVRDDYGHGDEIWNTPFNRPDCYCGVGGAYCTEDNTCQEKDV